MSALKHRPRCPMTAYRPTKAQRELLAKFGRSQLARPSAWTVMERRSVRALVWHGVLRFQIRPEGNCYIRSSRRVRKERRERRGGAGK